MDELAASLEGSFHVTNLKNDPCTVHPRFALYKSKNIVYDQEKRRQLALEQQKQKRFDAINDSRHLAAEEEEDAENDVEEDGAEEGEEGNVDVSYYKNTRNYFPSYNYRNKLMLSEWMLEIPENFENDWVMIPCPVGKRCLVVAMQGQTRAYSRHGQLIYKFHSALPGGSYQTKYKNNSALLDCIYSDVSQCFYVLDVLSWNRQVMQDTDTEFRFFWLATKFLEFPEIQESTRLNPYVFTLLPNYYCKRDVIVDLMSSPFDYELDGLLFYHKGAFYTAGSTPLAVWLKAYMLPEILDVPVSEKLLSLAPAAYSGFQRHADQVRTRKVQWEKKMADRGNEAGDKNDAEGGKNDAEGNENDVEGDKSIEHDGDKLEGDGSAEVGVDNGVAMVPEATE